MAEARSVTPVKGLLEDAGRTRDDEMGLIMEVGL